jgi:hypothetical protein
MGRIGEQVAEFDIYTSSANPLIAGGAAVDTTVTGDQSFKPEAGTVADSAAGTVTNVDYRNATIPVAASASYNVGDKVTITNPLGTVKSIGLDTKQSTGQAMTFTIKAKPTGTSLIISPKPIAADDSALSDLEKASANIDTIILDTATVNRVNTDTSVQTNIFWDKSAVEIVGGTLPADKFKEFGGMKQLSETLSNGLTLYCFWDGNIETLTFDYRCFLWYGVNIANPSNCGVMTTY